MRRAGEIRIVRSAGYDEVEEYTGVRDEVMEIARDLLGLVLSLAVMVFIVLLAGGWM